MSHSTHSVKLSGHSELLFACRISHDSILCCASIDRQLNKDDTIFVSGHMAAKPYQGITFSLEGRPLTILLLSSEALEAMSSVSEIVIANPQNDMRWQASHPLLLDEQASGFPAFARRLPRSAHKKLLFLLYNFFIQRPRSAQHAMFARLLQHVRELTTEEAAHRLFNTVWILPDVLYAEMELPQGQVAASQLLATSAQGMYLARAESMMLYELPNLPGTCRFGFLYIFPKGTSERASKGKLTLFQGTHCIPIIGSLPVPKPALPNFIHLLSRYDQNLRERLREFAAKHLLEEAQRTQDDAALPTVIQHLQHFIPTQHTSVFDKQYPFGANIESAFALGNQSIFLFGWIRDPLQLTEAITLHLDIGISFSITDQLRYFARPQVDTLYQGSPTEDMQGKWGVVALIPIPEEMQQQLESVASLHGMRLEFELKGGLRYSITPPVSFFDPFALRTQLLTVIAPQMNGNDTANAIVRDATLAVQQACATQAKVKETIQFGAPIKKPIASLVIPLYQSLDFFKAQMAHFSHDPALEQCEIFYVLDSPEQEAELRRLCEESSVIYQRPITLLIMERNSGYAIATNHGAAAASGEYLVLLNSDVLPIAHGWLDSLKGSLAKQKYIGVVGPKLLYEDGSIQHAGMYFAQDMTDTHYENRHYAKGYTSQHASSLISKEVPAVTGACMMMRRSVWNDVGGLSTDYVIGDFEDSDLCLRLRERKLSAYYCAEVEMYHLERQSFVSHTAHRGGAALQFNAWLHQQRWANTIDSLMEGYRAAKAS